MHPELIIATACLIIVGILIRGDLRGNAGRLFLIRLSFLVVMLGLVFLLMKQAEHFRHGFENPRNISHLLLFPFLKWGELLEKWLPGVLNGTTGFIRSAGIYYLAHRNDVIRGLVVAIPTLAIILTALSLWKNPLPPFFLIMSLFLSVIAIIYSKQRDTTSALILAGAAAASAIVYSCTSQSHRDYFRISPAVSRWLICLIILLAAAVRTYQLYETAARFDNWEALYGQEAIKVLAGHHPVALWSDTSWRGLGHTGHFSAVFIYLHALFFRLFGPNLVASRLVSAAGGILTVFILYRFIRLLFNETIGLLAAALIAFSPIHINFTRVTNLVSLSVMTGYLILCLLLQAIRYNRSSTYFFLGLVFSFMGYLYEPIMIFFPLSCFILLVCIIFRRGFFRKNWRGILMMFAAIYLVMFFLHIPVWDRMFPRLFVNESVWHRTQSHQYTSEPDYTRAVPLILENLEKLFMSFVRDGRFNYDIWPRGNLYFNPILSALCFWGIFYSILHLNRSRYLLVLFLAAVFFPPNILTRPPVIVRRLLFLLPLLYFFAALPLYRLGEEICRLFPGKGKKIALIMLGVPLLLIVSYNSSIYFNSKAHAGRWEDARFFDEYVKDHVGEYYVYIIPLKENSKTTIDFLLWEKIENGRPGDYYRYVNPGDIRGLIGETASGERPSVYICHPARERREELDAVARDMGERARVEEHRDPFGRLCAYALFIE